MHHRRTDAVLIAGLLVGLAGLGLTDKAARGLVERGNEAYRNGMLDDAITLYERADERLADDAVLLYDRATALAATGERGRAESLFRKADAAAGSDEVRRAARFNLGHTLAGAGRELIAQDAQAAIDLLRQSAAAYKSVLRVDPTDHQAAANVERVRRTIKLIQDQLELEQKLEELQSQQRDAQGKGAKPQEGVSDETEQAKSTIDEALEQDVNAGDPQQMRDAQEALDEARKAQDQAEQAMDQGDQDEAQQQQSRASEKIQEALDKLREAMQQQQSQQQGQPQDQGEPSDESGPEGDPLAEQLLDKERREREQRAAYLNRIRPGQAPVRRDW